MVHWGWLIGALFLGKLMGIVAMAILYGSWSHEEEKKGQKKRSADGGTSTNQSDSRKDFYL